MPETLTAPTGANQGFHALQLPQTLLNKLDRASIVTPTPIQQQAIPVVLEGRDVIGIAQTGTGKTLAFALPIVARLEPGELTLVLAPTRELAEQIEKVFQMLNVRTALIIGGEGMQRQLHALRGRPDVIVATPGRLEDHIARGYKALKHAAVVVLDEADRMLDMGFAPAIRRILGETPNSRQTLLFSATMPREIADMAAVYLNDPVRVEVKTAGTAADGIDQELVMVHKDDKPEMLGQLLNDHKGTVLVFARTRHGARKIAHSIRILGHTAAEIHADRSLAQRREALEGFKRGRHRVLVATDIAARGIDVKEIEVVINYDVPEKPEDYVHRIGRTGRAGSKGLAIMIATPEQSRDVRDIERLLRTEFLLSPRSREKMDRSNPGSGGRSPQRKQGGGAPRAANIPRPTGGSWRFAPAKKRGR